MFPCLETHGRYAIGVPVTTQRPSSRRSAVAEKKDEHGGPPASDTLANLIALVEVSDDGVTLIKSPTRDLYRVVVTVNGALHRFPADDPVDAINDAYAALIGGAP